MGIDAEMLIRIRQDEPPTSDQLTRWGFDLVATFGTSVLFVRPGVEHPGIDAWHERFNAHPLYSDFRAATFDGRRSIRERIVADVGECPPEHRPALALCKSESGPLGKVWEQDGPDIIADDGEWFVRVSLWGRYYGPGYERGDILSYCAIAEWIEANIPNASVWYGGDSSDVCAEPFDAEARNAMRRHLVSAHGRDYWHSGMGRRFGGNPEPCSLCIPGEPRFTGCGGSRDYDIVACGGCGRTFQGRDATWTVRPKDDL